MYKLNLMARKSIRRKSSRKHRGGYSSASTYAAHVVGNSASQYARTLDQSGPFGKIPGNLIIGSQGQNALKMTAGKRKKKCCKTKKRGGSMSSIFAQSLVPLSLLGVQQIYGKKNSHKSDSKRTSM